ncbi:MAG TPA: DUF4136 domain-containing protein [Bryobacteraceae bacterium]|nr:DUF4136 domain-containing protein [Bryobacteraceae bacterium]
MANIGRIRTGIFAVIAGATLASGQQVATQYDRSVTFTSFHTYKWVTVQGAQQPDQITAQNIQNAVNAQLQQKGLTMVEDNPDLLVGYQIGISQQQQLNYWNSGWGWGGGMGQATTSTVHVGELVLDMYASGKHTLVWRGSVAKSLNPSSNPDKNYRNLQKAVEKLLKKFPPQ